MTAEEILRDETASALRRWRARVKAYDARRKQLNARVSLPCPHCRKQIAVGEPIVKPGGKRFFWFYCAECGDDAHATDRPRLNSDDRRRAERFEMLDSADEVYGVKRGAA